jgi:(2Fe-2S) ferredoxin
MREGTTQEKCNRSCKDGPTPGVWHALDIYREPNESGKGLAPKSRSVA